MNAILILCFFGILTSTTHPSSTTSLSLEELYQKALMHYPTIEAQEAAIHKAEAQSRAAFGAILPQIKLLGSYQWQEDTMVSGVSSPSRQPSLRFQGTQALFRGLREYQALQGSFAGESAASAKKWAAKQLLYELILRIFFQSLISISDTKNLSEQKEVLSQRHRETEKRIKDGRSRMSELLSIEVSQAELDIELEKAISSQRQSLNELKSLCQIDISQSIELTAPTDIQSSTALSLEKMENRPDIKALIAQIEITERSWKAAWGAHFPSLDATGNYYLKRSGSLENIAWDIVLSLQVPLFEGGSTHAKVAEARYDLQMAQLELKQAKDNIYRDLIKMKDEIESMKERLDLYEKATLLSKRNVESMQRDFRLGLVSHLDSLNALINFHQSIRRRDQLKFQVRQLEKEFEIQSGQKDLL